MENLLHANYDTGYYDRDRHIPSLMEFISSEVYELAATNKVWLNCHDENGMACVVTHGSDRGAQG